MSSKAAARIVGASALGLYSGLVLAAADPYQLNLPEPQSIIAQQIYDMHTMLLWICLVIFVGVFGVMFYSVLKHRKSLGYPAANFHHSTTVEIIWTIIPFFILVGMAYPATKTVIAMKDTSSPDITIKATGYQWKWGYDYLTGEGEGISFCSNLSTPKAQIENAAPKGENYLLEVDNPPGGAGGQEGAHTADRQRRDPRLVGAGAWASSRMPFPASFATPGSRWTSRHLSRSMRRAVRQGARLHADRRGSGDAGEVCPVGGRAEDRNRRRRLSMSTRNSRWMS